VKRDDPVGDLARDEKRFTRSPLIEPTSFEHLEGQLRFRRACEEAIDAARIAWREYRATRGATDGAPQDP
jgi:hypothetical protein